MKCLLTGLLACGLIGSAAMAIAADPPVANQPNPGVAVGPAMSVATTFRASKLMGMNVKNMQGEKLGTIDDIVIDMQKGHTSYVALGVGGVLGIGEKLFAVPFHEIQFKHDRDENYFVLNVSKEQLKDAPGFDKSNWPDFADPNFTQKIDQYYQRASTDNRGATRQ